MAFGAVLYEMLSGKRAFGAASAAETMSAVLKEDPSPLSTLAGTLPPALERTIFRCLGRQPDQGVLRPYREQRADVHSYSRLLVDLYVAQGLR